MKRPVCLRLGSSMGSLLWASCLAVASLHATHAALADEAGATPAGPEPAATSASRQRPGSAVEEITVVARKRTESLQDVPVAVSAFSGVQLEQAGVEEFFDLQYITPNLQFTSDSTGGATAQIVLRGQAQADTLLTTDSSVGIYLDGVNLPRQLRLRSNQFELERVEVLKGPQGTPATRRCRAR